LAHSFTGAVSLVARDGQIARPRRQLRATLITSGSM
jgi:hypothetical protein